MTYFLLRRIVQCIFVLWAVSTLVFLIVRLAPGDPFTSQKGLSKEVREVRSERWGLDEPFVVQYGNFLANVATGNFGRSMKRKTFTVNEIIQASFPVSATLGLLALCIALFFGILIGSLAAAGQNTFQDHLVMSISVVGICLPTFVTGPLLVLIFSFYIGGLPPAGWPVNLGDVSKLILPATTLALPYMAYIARLTRTSMLDELNADYIRTALSKGLKERQVVFDHALQNALVPIISYLGPAFAYILTGSVVVEKIFRIPGVGKQFINAAINRDYNLVQGITILFCFFVIAFNALSDIGYAFVDPRVRLNNS